MWQWGYGGQLLNGANIITLTNVSSNKDQFAIKTSGGSGICAGKAILFPSWKAVSEKAHSRAYSAALTALTTGLKVKIHNYENDSCTEATFIRLNAD